MDKILADFGVQPVYLAAQVVNFIILLLILKRFLYRPILQVLEDRKKTVTESLMNAKQIEVQLQTTEQESARKLSEVSKQAKVILDNATNTANQIIADAHEKAQADIESMIEKGQQNILVEREMMKKEMSDELSGLVLIGIERIAEKVLDHQEHIKIVDQTIQGLKEDISAKAL